MTAFENNTGLGLQCPVPGPMSDVSHPNPLTFNYHRQAGPGSGAALPLFEQIMAKLGFKLAFTDPVKE